MTTEERARAVEMLDGGASIRRIRFFHLFNCKSHKILHRYCWKSYLNTIWYIRTSLICYVLCVKRHTPVTLTSLKLVSCNGFYSKYFLKSFMKGQIIKGKWLKFNKMARLIFAWRQIFVLIFVHFRFFVRITTTLLQ